tara:strand:+ start:203 stop:523 length:321 start_codon:yes stop_codon:yes gene_type:complete
MLKVSVLNSEDVNVTGSSLVGYVKTTYDTLVEKFGDPTYTYGDKTTAEWKLEFDVGDDWVTATIYDWKTYDTPMGEYDWHIGGFSMDAVDVVTEALNKELSNASQY